MQSRLPTGHRKRRRVPPRACVRSCVRACVSACVRACVCIRWKFVLSRVCAASFNYIGEVLRSSHKRIV